MNPLAVVEAHLRTVDIWPPYVLRDMILWQPNSRGTKKVAAFMYWNGVRLRDAVACCNACNGRHQRLVEMALRAWYDVWDRDEKSEPHGRVL